MPHDPLATPPPPGPHYREVSPPAQLSDRLSCVWTSQAAATAPKRIVPDGCVDLMWMADGAGGRLVVAGPDTRAHLTSLAAGSTIAAVRFVPGGARQVLGLPLDAVRDARPDVGDLWGEATALRLRAALSASTRPELVLLAAVRQRSGPRPDAAARHVAGMLQRDLRPRPVGRLADELGMSERQLHRRCLDAFGYGAKTLHRVLRFQAALGAARQGRDLARVAHETGYADQPHLARDVAALSDTTMTALLATA